MICDGCTAKAGDVQDIYTRATIDTIQQAWQMQYISCTHSCAYDLNYDNLLIDRFWDADGYCATVCTGSTTSCYNATTCYYINDCKTACGFTTCYYACNCATTCTKCHYKQSASGGSGTDEGCACSCSTAGPTFGDMDCYPCYVLCIRTDTWISGASTGSPRACASWVLNCPNLTYCCEITGVDSAPCATCIVYIRTAACCFDIYCNGICLCAINPGAADCLCFCSAGCSYTNCVHYQAYYAVCWCNAYLSCSKNSIICIAKKNYGNKICDTFLAYQGSLSTGATVDYDVLDSADTVIGCCLAPNVANYLSTCCCCISIRINQCDCYSCICAYGLAVGFA